jgi:hypothetical protein
MTRKISHFNIERDGIVVARTDGNSLAELYAMTNRLNEGWRFGSPRCVGVTVWQGAAS